MISLFASIGVPTAAECFRMLAPFAGIIAMFWVIGSADGWIRRLFPRPDWEEQLGWLRLRAERKASRMLRWGGYAVHAIFAIFLLGIVWGAVAVGRWGAQPDNGTLRELLIRLPILVSSFVLCLGYVVAELLPRLRREFDEEELVRFRAENPDPDKLGRRVKTSRSRAGSGGSLLGEQPRRRR